MKISILKLNKQKEVISRTELAEVARMIKEGMLKKLDYSNIPNFVNIMEKFKNPLYDPGNEYSVPYTCARLPS